MKNSTYNYRSNLVETNYTADLVKIIQAAGGIVTRVTPYCYSKSMYSASWIQRVQYTKDGENRVAYQLCGDGIYDEIFASWFWCPADRDPSLAVVNHLLRGEDTPSSFDEMPSDMVSVKFA